jgi:agmatinase
MNVIPANIEKSFDQITKAVSYVHDRAVFPVILGGDH